MKTATQRAEMLGITIVPVQIEKREEVSPPLDWLELFFLPLATCVCTAQLWGKPFLDYFDYAREAWNATWGRTVWRL